MSHASTGSTTIARLAGRLGVGVAVVALGIATLAAPAGAVARDTHAAQATSHGASDGSLVRPHDDSGEVVCVSEISGVQYTVTASLGGTVTLGGFQPDTLTGTCTLSGSNSGDVVDIGGLGSLVLTDGFENDGTIDLTGDDLTITGAGTFTNAGTFLDESPGFSQTLSVVDLVNTGTITAVEPSGASEGPDLFLVAGSSASSGSVLDDDATVSAGAGASIDVEDGTFVLEPTGTITAGPGSFGIGSGGTIEVAGGTVTDGDIGEDYFLGTCIHGIVFDAGISSASTGTIAGSCPVTLTGTVPTGWTVDAGGSVTATPGSGNAGSIVLDGDDQTVSSTGTFTNAGSLIDEDGGFSQSLEVADLVNTGTVSSAEPAGSSSGPSLSLADGTNDVFEDQGTVAAGASSTISVETGTFQLDEGGSVTAGPGSFGLGTGGSLVVDGGTVTGGAIQTFEFLGTCATSMRFGSTIPADSAGTINNSCPITLSGTIPAGWTFDTSTSLTAASGAGNAGTLDLEGNNLVDGGSFANTGLLETDGGNAEVEVASFSCAGAGEVDVAAGQLGFADTPTNLAGGTLTGCTWDASGPLRLTEPVTTLDASVSEIGAGALEAGGSDALSGLTTIGTGGSLSELGGRDLAITGSLVNDGAISLSSTSSLSVAGTLAEAPTSSLRTGIDDTAVGSISVAGTATIAGDVQATLDGGSTSPPLGTDLQVLTAAGTSGSFSTQELASLQAPDFLWVAYPSTGVALQVVDEPQTRVALQTSGTPSDFGADVTYTATLTGGDGGGTVGFLDGGAAISGCTAVPLVDASAACTLGTESVGSHAITATYSGDAAVAGSTSPVLTQVVEPAATSIGIATSGTPSAAGSQVTYTATVSDGDGGGSVAFFDDGVAVGSCQDQALATDVATCVLTGQSVGSHAMTAVYTGDSDSEGSSSTTLTQVVDQVTGVTDAATGGATGPLGGGDQLTVTGTGFTGATEVLFVDGACTTDAGTVSATVGASGLTVSPDGTSIVLTSPSELADAANECAGTGLVTDVVVTTSSALSAVAASAPDDEYTFVVPQVSAVTDAQTQGAAGPLLGGEQLIISGSGLAGATKVSFVDASCTGDAGTTSASVGAAGLVVAPDGTSITLTSPGDALDAANACAGTAGIVTDVVVTVGSDEASQVEASDSFTFELPVVAGVVDTDSTFQGGPFVGGNELVVYGSGLTGASRVEFLLGGTVEATVPTSGGSDSGVAITAPDLTALVSKLAPGSSSLTLALHVQIPDASAPGGYLASAVSPYDGLSYLVPTVTSVRTATGASKASLLGGETLTVHGTGLLGDLRVAFTYRDSAGATASLVVPAQSNTEDGTTLTVVAPSLGAVVGIKGATALKLAKGQATVAIAVRVIDVNPTTHHQFEGPAGTKDGFTLVVPAPQAPSFTSRSTAAGAAKEKLSLLVTSTGWPNAKITVGSHPSWLTLTSLGNGTATITGTPTKAGTVKLTLTAKNGVGRSATQHLTISVDS